MNKIKMDTPISFNVLIERVLVAQAFSPLAVFVKRNGDIFAIFEDTIKGKSLVGLPKYGTKYVGNFHAKHKYTNIRKLINSKVKEF